MERRDLESLTREQLINEAEKLGVSRPKVLTQPELIDEIISRTVRAQDRAKARGWLGRARDLLARVVEKGLHLPEAAKALRSIPAPKAWPPPPPPLPTVTLAEIYAAQGHLNRALSVLEEVLTLEPDHEEALKLKAQLKAEPPTTAASPRDEESTASEPTIRPETRFESVEPPPPEEADENRFNIDEIVAIAVDPATVYVYWEVRPTTLARAVSRKPEGKLNVRLVTVTPSWSGPVATTRDFAVDALFGDRFMKDIPPGSNVRVSIGWLSGTEFSPFAVGMEVASPRALPTEAITQSLQTYEQLGPEHGTRSYSERAALVQRNATERIAESLRSALGRQSGTAAKPSFRGDVPSAAQAFGGASDLVRAPKGGSSEQHLFWQPPLPRGR